MALPAAERDAVMAYVFRQPRPVHAWVMARANDYYGRGVKADECSVTPLIFSPSQRCLNSVARSLGRTVRR